MRDLYIEGYKILGEYGVTKKFQIKFNGRFRNIYGRYRVSKDALPDTIELSSEQVRQHGWEETRKTFLHELAHMINFHVHGQLGHGEKFLEICAKIGGSHNPLQTKNRYIRSMFSHIPEPQLIKKRYRMTCSCGHVYTSNTTRWRDKGFRCMYCLNTLANCKLERT